MEQIISKENTIKSLKEYFSKNDNISMAFLFGSVMTGKYSPEPDVDIAVWFKEGYTHDNTTRVWAELEDILHYNVDLVTLNEARPTIAFAAIRGMPVKIEDKRFYIDYMLRTSSEAEDFCDYVIDLWKWRNKIRGASI